METLTPTDTPPGPIPRKRGRKPLPEHQRRSTTIGTRVTGAMAERLHALAVTHKTTISALTAKFYDSLLARYSG